MEGGGGGGHHKPSGTEIPTGWRVEVKKPSVGGGGGVWIFSGTVQFLLNESCTSLNKHKPLT